MLKTTASHAAIACLLLAHAAHAQTAPADPAAVSATDDTGSPADIVVTATKRAESVQTIPLSISAVGADALRDRNITDLSRLDVLVPGFKFGQSGNDARPAIRGTRTQQVIGNADPIVAFYNDGIYRSRPGQALGVFTDVERVEVARGPQGTLFGRNSFGGAIDVISRAPRLGEFDVGANFTVGNYNLLRGEAFVNAPLGDSWALRISGFAARRDGWVANLSNPENRLHDEDNDAIRVQLKGELGRVTTTFRAEYWRGGGAGPGDFGYFTPGVPINPATRRTNGVTGVIDPVISTVPGRGGGYGGLPVGTTGDTDWRQISRNFPFQRRLEQWTFSNDTFVEMGFADLRAILSYTNYRETRVGDPDYSVVAQDGAYNRVRTETGSQELQLISKPGGPFKWVVGAFFLQDRPNDLYVFGDDQTRRQNVPPGRFGIPGLISTVPELNRTDNLYVQGPFQSNTDSYAVYADGTYALTDWLKIIGGVRWTRDDRSAFIENVPFAGYPPFNTESRSRSFEEVTYRAGAQIDVARRSMVYGTYSTGFLAGGFSAAPSFSLTAPNISAFDPTTATAIEFGSKNVFLDGKLRANIVGYRNVYDNLITQVLTQVGNAVRTEAANAGTARSWGVETEIDWYPTEAAYLGFRAAYTHARFGNFIAGNNFQEGGNVVVGGIPVNAFQLRGRRVPLNPEFTLTAIGQYAIDAGRAGVWTPNVTVFYTTSYRTADQPFFFAEQPAYATLDAFLRWKPSRDSKYSVELFGNNITDERILLRTTPNAGQVVYQDFANPRFWGLRVGYNY